MNIFKYMTGEELLLLRVFGGEHCARQINRELHRRAATRQVVVRHSQPPRQFSRRQVALVA